MNNEQMQKGNILHLQIYRSLLGLFNLKFIVYLENEAYNEKLLSLNNELTALTSELSAKEKLGQRLRYLLIAIICRNYIS